MQNRELSWLCSGVKVGSAEFNGLDFVVALDIQSGSVGVQSW